MDGSACGAEAIPSSYFYSYSIGPFQGPNCPIGYGICGLLPKVILGSEDTYGSQ